MLFKCSQSTINFADFGTRNAKNYNVFKKLRTSNTLPTIRTMVSDQSEPELIDGDLGGGGGCDKGSRLGILTLTSRGFEARLVTSARYAD